MNIAGSLNYDTKIDTKGIDGGLDKIDKKASNVGGALQVALGNIISNLATMVAQGLKQIASSGITYNAQIEKYQTALTTLTGSAEEANKIIEQIKKDAASTPFDVQGLVQANQLLISAGVSSESARKDILALGNAISATGGGNEELSRMAVNLQQIKNVGKASSLDIKQFAYAGIDVYGLLADATGKTREEVSKMEVTYEDLTKALEIASKSGGRYANAMEKQSKTLNGQISNLKDNLDQFIGNAMKPLFDLLKNDILPVINAIIQGDGDLETLLTNLSDKLLDFITNALGNLIKKLPQFTQIGINIILNLIKGLTEKAPELVPVIVQVLTQLIQILAENADLIILAGIDLIVALIQGLTSEESINAIVEAVPKIIGALIQAIIVSIPALLEAVFNILKTVVSQIFSKLGELLSSGWEKVKTFGGTILSSVGNFAKNTFNNIIDGFKNLPSNIGKIVSEVLGHVVKFGANVVNWVKNDLPKIIDGIVDWFKKLPSRVWNALLNVVNKVIDWGGKLKEKGQQAAKSLFNSIVEVVTELPKKMLEIGKNIVEGVWNGIQKVKDKFKENIKKFFKGIVDGVKNVLGIGSPSKVFAKEVGHWIPAGVAVGIEANTDSVDKALDELNDEMINKMTQAVNVEAGKMAYSGTNGTITQMMSAFGTTTVLNDNKLYLDGDEIYANQQVVSAKKNLQTQFGGGYSVSS